VNELTNAVATYFLLDVSGVVAANVSHKPLPFRDKPHRGGVVNGTKHPRHVADDVRGHEHVVRVMMVGRGDVDPAATGQ